MQSNTYCNKSTV